MSEGLAARGVYASSPAGQGVVPAALHKVAYVEPGAEAISVPDSSGELLAPRQVCPGSKSGISLSREGKGLGIAWLSTSAVRIVRLMIQSYEYLLPTIYRAMC